MKPRLCSRWSEFLKHPAAFSALPIVHSAGFHTGGRSAILLRVLLCEACVFSHRTLVTDTGSSPQTDCCCEGEFHGDSLQAKLILSRLSVPLVLALCSNGAASWQLLAPFRIRVLHSSVLFAVHDPG